MHPAPMQNIVTRKVRTIVSSAWITAWVDTSDGRSRGHANATTSAPRATHLAMSIPVSTPPLAINGIDIGDDVNMGPGVGLISANHDPLDNAKHLPAPPIKIGNRCWIGMNAILLPGVELGENVVVAAGSVVAKSFRKGYQVVAGNPARLALDIPRPEPDESDR